MARSIHFPQTLLREAALSAHQTHALRSKVRHRWPIAESALDLLYGQRIVAWRLRCDRRSESLAHREAHAQMTVSGATMRLIAYARSVVASFPGCEVNSGARYSSGSRLSRDSASVLQGTEPADSYASIDARSGTQR